MSDDKQVQIIHFPCCNGVMSVRIFPCENNIEWNDEIVQCANMGAKIEVVNLLDFLKLPFMNHEDSCPKTIKQ